jgi:hypothetical protein
VLEKSAPPFLYEVSMITQDQLKSMFHYNHNTGVFKRKVARCNSIKAGDVVGTEHRQSESLSYLEVEIDGQCHKLHRLAFLYMEGELPPAHVDHIDGNGLNNAWANLRHVDRSTNQRNRKLNANNLSGCAGVSWYAPKGEWRAAINTAAGKKHIGYFPELSDAIAARKQAEITHGYHANHGRKAA